MFQAKSYHFFVKIVWTTVKLYRILILHCLYHCGHQSDPLYVQKESKTWEASSCVLKKRKANVYNCEMLQMQIDKNNNNCNEWSIQIGKSCNSSCCCFILIMSPNYLTVFLCNSFRISLNTSLDASVCQSCSMMWEKQVGKNNGVILT